MKYSNDGAEFFGIAVRWTSTEYMRWQT